MRLRDMLAAAVRPWFSVEAKPQHIAVTVSPRRHSGDQFRVVIGERGSDGPYLWGKSHTFFVGDLRVGLCRSWPSRVPTRRRAANDSKAAA